jgi:adenylate cyclase
MNDRAAASTDPPPAAVVEAGTATAAPRDPPRRPIRGRLFRKYVTLFVAVVSAALLISGILQIWFAYEEQTRSLIRFQQEQAKAAAQKIGQFVREIESQIGWTTQLPWSATTFEQRRFDAQRLLRQVPAITEVAMLDGEGREQLRVSRLSMDVIGSEKDLSAEPTFTGAIADKVYFGPVYFRRESEPYMSVAMAGNRRAAGITVAEVNLKFIWDIVLQIKVGESGRAYVVDRSGRLIAHPDISLVLRNTDLSGLAQVRAAFAAVPGDKPVKVSDDLNGRRVLTAYSEVAPLSWHVFVELPFREAYQPIYAAMAWSGALLVSGLLLAALAGLLLARRMVGPIRILQQGAARIGEGALDERIRIETGDEIEDLADQFNQMGEKLQQLYRNLERVSQLKRYFSPHLAEMIVSSEENILGASRRRDITVLFCDLRGFTAFSSAALPETVMQVLGEYYRCLGIEVQRYEATIGYFAGDGLMAFLNDPLPCPDHQAKAIAMSMAMRDGVSSLIEGWRARGIDLGFGIGIASGYATLGHIGSDEQFHYTAIGPVVNLASRLCDEARDGQILIDSTVRAAVESSAPVVPVPDVRLKGFSASVAVYRVDEIRLPIDPAGR